MISEPELEGELSAPATVPAPRGPEHPAETMGAEGSPLIPGPPLRRRPWVWGLTGVLVTSAVWAGSLWAYDRAGPDLQGYGVSRNLCLDADLAALSAVLGKKRDPFAAVGEDKALDQAVCTVNLAPERPPRSEGHRGPTVRAYAEITYTLHKKTDPGPQFDASLVEPADQGAGEQILKLVPEVGERAYLVSRPGDESPSLEVLDGQAVLSLSVGQVTEYNDADPLNPGFESDDRGIVHLGGLEPAMVEDMLALMDELKKK
ncbi:hypothetical protein SSPS47_22495 [Streptomyces sp. S4.7]|uniref:hypothetical protein n=1 Tax=Streptomyces sp. S4.7 TaxID=2705439 RepID=UPI0013983BB0|nr:hypothetical protein [Streptomyces sp. S4.7]QHY97884.1 hypothetical protein SSPS47_22495 [Streptomyces sp. S4.7]